MRIGILGAGGFARFMAQEMRRCDGIEVVAVASSSAERAAEIPGTRYFSRYEDLLTDPEVDAVYNALSNHLHFPWTVAALAHGKPVLCEKPLGVNAEETALMHDAAVAAGVPLMEGFWHLFHPKFALMRSLCESGAIGDVRHINTGFTHEWDFAGNFRAHPDFGGGMILDLGCYPLSTVLWFWPEAHVTSAVSLAHEVNDLGTDMHTEASVTLSQGVTATITASAQRPPRRWLEILGSEGSLRCDEPAFSHFPEDAAGSKVWLESNDGQPEIQEWLIPASDPRVVMLEHWRDVVAGASSAAIGSRLSIRTAHGLDVIRESATRG